MHPMQRKSWIALLVVLALLAAACSSGDDDDTGAVTDDRTSADDDSGDTSAGDDSAGDDTSPDPTATPAPAATSGDSGGGDSEDDPPPPVEVRQTLKIGYAYPDVQAFAVLNDKFSIGDPEVQAAAVLQAWRRDGLMPLNGTDIELVYGKYNILNSDDKLGLCTRFAQDEEVFAVIAGRDFQVGAECLAARFGIPVIDSSGLADSVYQRTTPWLFTIRASESQVLDAFVAWADAMGALEGRRIGVFWDDRSEEAIDVFKEALAEIGQEVASDLPSDGEGIGSPQDQIVVPRFTADDVDLAVMLVSTSSVTNFLASAESQNYAPELLWLEWANQLTDVSTQAYPQALVDGTLAMTMSRLGSIAAGEPLPDIAVSCIENFETFSGEDVALVSPESGKTNNTLFTCDLMSVLYEGLRNAGDEPTAESFVASLETIEEFPLALWGSLTFSPDDHAGVEEVRTVQWRTACECWTALDPFQDLTD